MHKDFPIFREVKIPAARPSFIPSSGRQVACKVACFGGLRGGAGLLAVECSFLHVRSEGHEVRFAPERSRFPIPAASRASDKSWNRGD